MSIRADLISCLHLTAEETYKFYDLYAAANSTIAIDVTQYIKQNAIVSKAIRSVKKYSDKEKRSAWVYRKDEQNYLLCAGGELTCCSTEFYT